MLGSTDVPVCEDGVCAVPAPDDRVGHLSEQAPPR